MRCWQVRKKLAQSERIDRLLTEDPAIQEHLDGCPACAALFRAERRLQDDLDIARTSDKSDNLSFTRLKETVEQRASTHLAKPVKEYPSMAKLKRSLLTRPKLSFSLSFAVLFLIAAMLIPFSYDRTVGYEVAFAGVDKNLAMDSDKIQHLLIKLGIDDAKFDVSDCEETCKLKVYQLKSPEDAKIIAAAFDEIENTVLLDDIKAITEHDSGNLFHKIKVEYIDGSNGDITFFSKDQAHQVLVERLGDSLQAELMIWISDDSLNGEQISVTSDAIFFSDSNEFIGADIGDCSGVKVSVEQTVEDGNRTLKLYTDDSDTPEIIELHDGEIDEATRQRLQELGINLQMLEGSSDGEHKMMFIQEIETKDCTTTTGTDDTDTAEKTATGELPASYQLAQNYPNPFNPTTTIEFNLPTTEYVTLEVFNINGQKVKTLVNDIMSAGTHAIEWDATSESGNKVASGVYLYKLSAGDFTETKKMTLMK